MMMVRFSQLIDVNPTSEHWPASKVFGTRWEDRWFNLVTIIRRAAKAAATPMVVATGPLHGEASRWV